MRSVPAAILLIVLLIFTLGARLRGSEDGAEYFPTPSGFGLDRATLSSRATLRATLISPTCSSPVNYAVIPAHDVSIDPSSVTIGITRARTVVVYGGLQVPAVFTAEIIDALYLVRRLAQVLGLSQASFSSMFVTRFTVSPDCGKATDIYLKNIASP